MPSLYTTVTGVNGNTMIILIRQQLHLHMTDMFQHTHDKDMTPFDFLRDGKEHVFHLRGGGTLPNTFSPTTFRGLNHDWEPNPSTHLNTLLRRRHIGPIVRNRINIDTSRV